MVRLRKNSTFYSQKREKKNVHFISILNFIQTFRHLVILREIRFYMKLCLFSNFEDCAGGGILYSKNNLYRTSGPMSLYTFHQLIVSAFGYKQRSPQLCDLCSFHEHFHAEHRHICASPKFIRTDNIIQCVHKSTLKTRMKTDTYNHITYNVDYQSDFYIIPNSNAEVQVYVNHGTNTAYTRQSLLILYVIHNTAVKMQCEGQERMEWDLATAGEHFHWPTPS